MESKSTTTKFIYCIEPKPEGGFIARPSGGQPDDPAMEPIEGATREEVQQKIEAKLTEFIEQQMPTMFKLGGINFTVNRKLNITTQSAFGKTITTRQDTLPPGSDLMNVSAPIVPSSSGGTMLRVLAFLIGLVLMYVFFVVRR